MLFRVIAAVASVAFISQGALAQQPAQVLVTAINLATTQTEAANTALALITPLTPPVQIATVVTTVAQSYNTVIEELTALLSSIPPPPPVCDKSEYHGVDDTVKLFVRSHQALLRVIVSKTGLFSDEQNLRIGALLASLESSFAALAADVIRLAPCTADDISAIVDEIERALGQAIILVN